MAFVVQKNKIGMKYELNDVERFTLQLGIEPRGLNNCCEFLPLP